MLWSFKYDGNGHHGYHNKNRAAKGLISEKAICLILYVTIKCNKICLKSWINIFLSKVKSMIIPI